MNDLVLREQQAKGLIKEQMAKLSMALNKDERKASVFAGAILAMSTDPNLRGCDVESIIKNGVAIVQLGLNPNKSFGQAYVVPYGKTAQLQIGYKGFLALAYRNGWAFRAVCVYKCDDFSISFGGICDHISFSPNYDLRSEDEAEWVFKNLKGVIVYAKDKQGNEFSEFVPFSKLEKLRLKSQNQNDKNALKHIWAEWSEEMYKAKALKYVATRLPITEQIQEAINYENAVFDETPAKTKAKKQDLNELTKEPPIIDVSTGEVLEPNPYELLQNELISKGLNPNRAEDIATRYSKEQVEQILADPSSIDELIG